MGDQGNLRKEVEPEMGLARSKQLAISLQFHHRETLQRISLEAAVRAMAEVWESCHSKSLPKDCSGTSTAIIPKEQVAKSIRESKFFSG